MTQWGSEVGVRSAKKVSGVAAGLVGTEKKEGGERKMGLWRTSGREDIVLRQGRTAPSHSGQGEREGGRSDLGGKGARKRLIR